MHDINGKNLRIGDDVVTYAYGLCKITEVKEEHNADKGGALIEVASSGRPTARYNIRTHEHKVVKVRPWKELAREALAIQDASNLSAVAITFTEVIREARARMETEDDGKAGDKWNQHPLFALYSDKIAHLTNTQTIGNDQVSKAYKWAHDQTEPSRPVVG